MDKPPEKPKVINIGDSTQFKKNQHQIENDLDIKKLQAEALFQKGLSAEETRSGREEAILCYKRALELYPGMSGAAVNLGTIYFNRKQFEDAENLYLQAIEADPEYPLAWFNLGNVQDELRRDDKAINCYEKAIKLNPKYPDALFNLGLLYEKHSDLMKALSVYQRYMKIPDTPESCKKVIANQISKIKKRLVLTKNEQQEPKQ